jgi:hypothetical protein
MPRLSIVIPTRQRPHLLHHAVRSAMAMRPPAGGAEVEVVVSANGDPTGAREVVAPYQGRAGAVHLRYVEVGADVDAFRSWHFGLKAATGDHVMILADDDCLTPDAAALMCEALDGYAEPEVLSLASCWYGHESVEPPRRNALRFDTGWKEGGPREPQALLRAMFAFRRATFSPTYVLVARRILAELAARKVNPFGPIFPDYCMQAMALGLARSAALTREPVVVHGYAAESAGETYFAKRQDIRWPAPDGEDHPFRCSPVRGYVFINGWLETLLRARKALPDVLGAVDVHWTEFFVRYAATLADEAVWRDVRADAEELLALIERLGPAVQEQLTQHPSAGLAFDRLASYTRNRAWTLLDEGLTGPWLRGEDHRFSDIVAGAAKVRGLYHRHLAQLDLRRKLRDGVDVLGAAADALESHEPLAAAGASAGAGDGLAADPANDVEPGRPRAHEGG